MLQGAKGLPDAGISVTIQKMAVRLVAPTGLKSPRVRFDSARHADIFAKENRHGQRHFG
jgi:hypothetical protein